MAGEGNTPLLDATGYQVEDAGQPSTEALPLAAPPLASASTTHRLGQRQRLVDLIQQNGAIREDQRCGEIEELRRQAMTESGGASSSGKSFSADLVYKEEASDFELWLGCLEDALSLEGLRERGVSAILNCAVEECRRECATFRCESTPDVPVRGRRRTHARGASLANDGEAAASRRNLPLDVLRSLVEFNGFWYSEMCDCDMAYLGLAAADEDGYRMDNHFEEVQEFLDECRQEGRKVLVHCIMGINRSSVALVSFLCRGVGMELSEAVALASKQRGFILSNNSFLDQLIEHFGKKEEAEAKG